MASFQSQYGIRLSKDLSGMKWREFKAYIAGLDEKSPLGRLIMIRAEIDPKVISRFTENQREIRSKWRSRRAKTVPQKDLDQFLASMEELFKGMGGAHEEDQVH